MTTSRRVLAQISAATRGPHWRDGGRIALAPEPQRAPRRQARVYGPKPEGSESVNVDCGCLLSLHTGPHWLHMDGLNRTRNEAMIRRGIETGNVALVECGRQAEIQRLHEKARMLERQERAEQVAAALAAGLDVEKRAIQGRRGRES